jgi:chorismate mutase
LARADEDYKRRKNQSLMALATGKLAYGSHPKGSLCALAASPYGDWGLMGNMRSAIAEFHTDRDRGASRIKEERRQVLQWEANIKRNPGLDDPRAPYYDSERIEHIKRVEEEEKRSGLDATVVEDLLQNGFSMRHAGHGSAAKRRFAVRMLLEKKSRHAQVPRPPPMTLAELHAKADKERQRQRLLPLLGDR